MINHIVRSFRDDRALWAAALLSLSISGFLLWNYYCISADGVRYIDAAKNFYFGDIKAGLSSVYPPGYPVLLALFYNLVHDWERAGQIISLLARLLLLFPLYVLLRDLYGKSTATLGCFLAGLSPFLATYSVEVRTESLFFFLSTLILCAFHFGIERRKTSNFFIGGLLAGFAYLVRPEALGFVILIPMVLFFLWRMQRSWDWACIARVSFVMIVGFLIFAAPYVVYLSRVTGEWGAVSRKAGITLWYSLRDADLLEPEVLKNFPTPTSMSLLEFIRREPWIYTQKVFGDLLPSINVYFEALHYSYMPFLLLGFVKVLRGRFCKRKDILLFSYLIFFMISFIAIYVNRRYLVQLVPVSLGWTAIGMLWTWEWMRNRWNQRSAGVALAFLSLVFLVATLPKTLKPVGKDKAHFKDVARYVREHHGPGDFNILVSDYRIAYYAGASPITLRDDWTEADIVAQMQQGNATFLVAEPKTLQTQCPGILSSPGSYGFRFEKEFVGFKKARLLLFKRT